MTSPAPVLENLRSQMPPRRPCKRPRPEMPLRTRRRRPASCSRAQNHSTKNLPCKNPVQLTTRPRLSILISWEPHTAKPKSRPDPNQPRAPAKRPGLSTSRSTSPIELLDNLSSLLDKTRRPKCLPVAVTPFRRSRLGPHGPPSSTSPHTCSPM